MWTDRKPSFAPGIEVSKLSGKKISRSPGPGEFARSFSRMEGANTVDIVSLTPMKSHLLLIQSISQKEEWHGDVQFVYSCENPSESDSIFSNVSIFFQNKILDEKILWLSQI